MGATLPEKPLTPAATVQNAAVGAAFEEYRDRVAMRFTIRLCGGPGSPTTSACGPATIGKPFGAAVESTWGWDNFIPDCDLEERPWLSGDVLRFLVVISVE